MTATLITLGAGLALLIAGGELLVRGASALARRLRIPPLVIGLTVVAFGTSAPELAVSVRSALRQQADLALGNVVGSNVFNVLLILGLSALLKPLVVERSMVRREVPIMIGVSLVPLGLGLDGRLGRPEGWLLVAGLVGYTLLQIRSVRRDPPRPSEESPPDPDGTRPLWSLLLVGSGLGLLVLGAEWAIDAAVALARALEVSELLIGLTLVAAGTSLPEVATSIIAALRDERDLAVGNVVGSNIFNILAVLGITTVMAPGGIAVSPSALRFDIPVMLAVAVACLPIFFTGYRIDRWEGGVFLGYYAAYVAVLFLAASGSPGLRTVTLALGGFLVPLTVLTLAVLTWRSWRGSAT
ncbi:MAG: calcium/sodium antiporter [Thermoanaerobaculia bacterium]|nr:calcium/sodium antiporter [Thermoanaerobaculia bacterium]